MGTETITATLESLISLRQPSRALELGARRSSLSVQAGGYRSVYRGRGLEFDEVRAYQAGDTARDIDWRVTARRGKPHTKIFREERERPVLITIDLDATMFFGSRLLKSVQAQRIAGLIAWATARAGDRIGGVVIGDGRSVALPARPRTDAVLHLLRHMQRLQPQAPLAPMAGALDQGLGRLVHVVHPGSLLPVISDFHGLTDDGERRLSRLSKHNDLLLILIFDPLEAEPPPAGRYRVALPGSIREIESSGTTGLRWRAAFEGHRQRLETLSRKIRAPLVMVSTDADPLQAIRYGLARHGRAA
ncbi:MAG: hypothetical protein ACI8W7_000207 [Gammaproteobacteria bacterium]|jgi:uncharacterized protein (DUF58 family)